MTVNGITKKRRKKKRYLGLYTTGELNRIVDSFIHPFFDRENSSIILDGVVHALLEKDVPKSAGKFIEYDLPEILKRLGKKGTVRRTRSKR